MNEEDVVGNRKMREPNNSNFRELKAALRQSQTSFRDSALPCSSSETSLEVTVKTLHYE